MRRGRELAINNTSDHTIHNLDGTIGEKNSNGNDPRKHPRLSRLPVIVGSWSLLGLATRHKLPQQSPLGGKWVAVPPGQLEVGHPTDLRPTVDESWDGRPEK